MAGYTIEPLDSAPKKYTIEPVDSGVGDALYKAGSVVGHIGKTVVDTGLNLFSGLYAWPASKVAGITTLLLSGDQGAADAVEQGVANELVAVKNPTKEAEYITNQIGRLIDIPMSFLGEMSDTAIQMMYTTPFRPSLITQNEAKYMMQPVFQMGAMPALFKVAKSGVGSLGKIGADVPQFLREMTGRGKAVEELKAVELEKAKAAAKAAEPPAPDIVQPAATPGGRGEYRKITDARTGEVLAESSTGRPVGEEFSPNVDIGEAFTKHMDKKIIDEHTHPDLSQASAEDLAVLGWSHVEKVRVKTIDGTIYEYSKPEGARLTPRAIKDAWNKADTELNDKLVGMSVEDYIAEIDKRVLSETGIQVKVIKSPSPMSGVEKGSDVIGSERGSFSKLPEEKPLLHEFPPEIEQRWKAAVPEQPTLMERGKSRIDEFYNKLTRVYEDLPNKAEYAPLNFELLNLQKYKGIASDKAAQGLAKVVEGFDKPLMDLFERKVIADDLMYTADHGMDLPYGFTRNSLATEKILIDDVVSKNPLVQEAIAKRQARWDEIKTSYADAMESIGLDVEGRFKNPDYFHHQVLAYAQAQGIAGAGKLKSPTNRGFLKQRKGSELDISRDYLQVEHDVQAQMIHDIKTAEVIKLVDERYNQAARIKAEAKAAGVEDWRKMIPEDSGLWQPKEGNVFYQSHTIPTKIANELLTGALEEFGIRAEDLKTTLSIGGPNREFVLKKEIINTLDNLTKPDHNNVVSKASAFLMRQWKEKIALIHPRGFFKYNARNMTGDGEAATIGNPHTWMKAPRSFMELYRVFFGDGKMTPDLNRFFELGGFEGTMQAIEMRSFGDIKVFEHLYNKNKGIMDIPRMIWDKYWKTARLATDLREGTLRYAAYLDYLEQMKKSPDGLPKNYGASIPEEIKALGDIERRAFWLQDDLLGAYDKVGVIGQELRTHIWPFWSWKEVNFKRYLQLWENAFNDGNLTTKIGLTLGAKTPFIAYRAGKMVLKMGAALALLEVYNQTFFKEEEKALPDNIRKSAHIILYKDSEGKTVYFDRLGMLQDFLSNFGLDQTGYLTKKVMNGEMTLKEAGWEMVKSPINVVAQGISPIWKTPAEITMGKTLFPDVTRPGKIRDTKLYIAQQLKLADEYKALTSLPSEGYAASLKKLFIYTSDPGQAAYMDIMDDKRRFAERNGKEGEGWFITPKGNALYNYKLALRYKDYKGAEHFLDEYLERGGTGAGLANSMKAMNPLYGMNPLDRMQFLGSLNSNQFDKLEKALDYYTKTLTGE